MNELWPHSSSVINILHFDTILMLLILSLQRSKPNKNARFAHGWFGLTKYSVCLKYEKKNAKIWCFLGARMHKIACHLTLSKPLHWEKPDPSSKLYSTSAVLALQSPAAHCVTDFFSSNKHIWYNMDQGGIPNSYSKRLYLYNLWILFSI